MAFSTSVAARSLRGLKLCFKTDANSSTSASAPEAGVVWACVSVAIVPPLLPVVLGRRARYHSVLQGRHQLRVGQQCLELGFCAGLAIHVAEEVGELLPSFQELGERWHLA